MARRRPQAPSPGATGTNNPDATRAARTFRPVRPFPACPALRKSHPIPREPAAGSGRRAEPPRVSHSPRVALGSGTVSVLLFPACGILTRFHGSCRAAAAMLRGAGEPVEDGARRDRVGRPRREREGGRKWGGGPRCAARRRGYAG